MGSAITLSNPAYHATCGLRVALIVRLHPQASVETLKYQFTKLPLKRVNAHLLNVKAILQVVTSITHLEMPDQDVTSRLARVLGIATSRESDLQSPSLI